MEITKTSCRAEETDQNNSLIITTKELIENNIQTEKEIPEPVKCQYCGKLLYNEVLMFMGTVATIRKEPQRCDCEQAQAYWQQIDSNEQEKEKQEAIDKLKAEYEKRLKKSHLSVRHRQCTFKGYKVTSQEQKTAVLKAYDYAKHFEQNYRNGQGLYIEGTNGTGKTHLAAAIAMYVMKTGKQVYCQTESSIYEDIRSTYDSDNSNSEKTIISKYQNVPLLIIDDLGKDKCTAWSLQILYNIVNSRYESMKPIIVTTNYNESELIKRLTVDGDTKNIKAIISRFRETTDLITMAWADYRGGA